MRSDNLPLPHLNDDHSHSASPRSDAADDSGKCVVSDSRTVGSDDCLLVSLHGDPTTNGAVELADLEKTALVSSGNSHLPDECTAKLLGQNFGRFRIQKEIARGGMGVVFEARDVEIDRQVAVKLLLKQHQNQPDLHRQFTNETLITGRLQHPGIIPIYETGVSPDGRPFFAMKLVQGKSLAELLTARSSLGDDLPRFLNIFELVCQTLSYVHSCGVLHLDIKPANVMVGAFGEVHLMDWGLAITIADFHRLTKTSNAAEHDGYSRQTHQDAALRSGISSSFLAVDMPIGTVRGTPAYMSPEQARGYHASVRSDLFGLGGILCEILTGRPPYRGENFLDVCFKATKADLCETYSTLIDSEADGVLVRLAMRCLSPEPEARPADAGAVASELTLYLESLMQRAESDLERFFELSLDLFCIAGLDGFFRRMNPNFERVLGYSERELLSRPFIDFVHPDDREQTVRIMSQLQLGQPVVRFRNRYSVSDGSWRDFEWTAKSVPKDNIIFAVARDVTRRVG